jgi:large subunit ribosomal protein L10
MSLTREQKKESLEAIKESLKKQNILIFANFSGLDVVSINEFRKQLKKIGAKVMVAKKSLTKIAFKELSIDLPKEALEKELALIFGFEEQIAVAKEAYNFANNNEALILKGGYLKENEKFDFLNVQELIEFAKLPSRQELYSKLLGTISAPLSNFVNVQKENIKGLFYALGAILEKNN